MNGPPLLAFKPVEQIEMSITECWKVYTAIIDVKATVVFDEQRLPNSPLEKLFLGDFSGIDFLLLVSVR